MGRLWGAVADFLERRYRAVLAAAIVVTVLLALGIPRLDFETDQDALIGKDSEVAKQNDTYQETFGGEVMLLIWDAPIEELATPENLRRQAELEAELKATGLFQAVLSPLSVLTLAANQLAVGPQLFEAAETAAAGDAETVAALQARVADEQTRLLATGIDPSTVLLGTDPDGSPVLPQPSDDPAQPWATGPSTNLYLTDAQVQRAFVEFLLYTSDAHDEIREILRDNFPDPDHGVTIVRLSGNQSIADIGKGADTVRAIAKRYDLGTGSPPLATGSPVYLKDINDYLQGGMTTLGLAAIVVMIVVLSLVFRRRWRLLSLGMVVLSAVATFGIMGLVGIPLNLVTISGLPILIGLCVDFAVQMHSRFEEELDEHGGAVQGALRRTMVDLAPALSVAIVAAVLGFLALQISRVPMIRQFGVMLDIGVVVIGLVVIFVPAAVLVGREHRWPSKEKHRAAHGRALERLVRALAAVPQALVVPLLVVGLVIVIGGLSVEGRFTIQTDPERWIPQDGATVESLDEARDVTGFTSELGFEISADDVTRTDVVAWMQRWAAAEVAKHDAARGGALVRQTSLPKIVTAVYDTPGVLPTEEEMNLLLYGQEEPQERYADITPLDVRISFLGDDKTKANIIFPIASVSLDARSQLVEDMQADLRSEELRPPEGVTVTPAGLATIGIELVDALQANREEMTYLSLLIVGVWLLVGYRRPVRMLITLIPALVAVGASALVVYFLGFELSPLTAVSGPLVIAVCTEFAVLIATRYLEERARGRLPIDAVHNGTVRIGRAFVASALTLIGGFAVIASSSFPLLRDFGIIVALNAAVAIVVALVFLPPLLVWVDRHFGLGSLATKRFVAEHALTTEDVAEGERVDAPEPTG